MIRVPATAAAGAAFESELTFLQAVAPYVATGALPFEVATIAGTSQLPEGGRSAVFPQLPGYPLVVETITAGSGLAVSLGQAIAAIHELPAGLLERTGHASYTAQEYRQRRLSELDEAAATRLVPTTLLTRWEERLDDEDSWAFTPTVTHTNIAAETILVRSGSVSAVTDWSNVQVGDPADDLAWLLTAAPAEAVDTIVGAYLGRRTSPVDDQLLTRASLASELALIRWLLYGVRAGLHDVIDDALSLLADLDASVAVSEGDLVSLPRYGQHLPSPEDYVATSALDLRAHGDAPVETTATGDGPEPGGPAAMTEPGEPVLELDEPAVALDEPVWESGEPVVEPAEPGEQPTDTQTMTTLAVEEHLTSSPAGVSEDGDSEDGDGSPGQPESHEAPETAVAPVSPVHMDETADDTDHTAL